MKKILTLKLKSNSGASLMAALLFFIMAATVGSIILAAATASSGRLAGLQRDEQAHYAVNSAASMFSEVIKDKKVIVKVSRSENTGTVPSTTVKYIDPETMQEFKGTDGFILLPEMVKGIYSAMNYEASIPDYTNPTTSKQTVTIAVGTDSALTTTAELVMNASLELVATFKPTVTGTKEILKVRYTPVVEMKETIEEHNMTNTVDGTNDKRVTVHVKTYTITWTNPVFE